jgi:hypothetical protein
MSNPYYSPEKSGLEILDTVDQSRVYEFDIFCVWRNLATGELYWDTDSGCSCPTPFDDVELSGPSTVAEIHAALDAWSNGTASADVADLHNKLANL